MNNTFKNIKAIAFDLDGTIYIGEKIIHGVIEAIDFLKKKNIKIFYFTNNSYRTKKSIHDKLLKFGLDLELSHVYSSSYATSAYLKEKKIKNVFCIGSDGLREELKNNSINIVDEANLSVEALIVGLDLDFNYNKMGIALNILKHDKVKFIACNIDRNYPVETNKWMPGLGSIIASIENCSERKADYIVGKPNTYMMQLLAKDWNMAPEEILLVGDTFDSDIEMAKRFGCSSILISDSGKYKDTITIPSVQSLQKWF